MRLVLSCKILPELLWKSPNTRGSVAHCAGELLDSSPNLIDTSGVMKVRALFVLYWAAMTLAGCGSPPTTSTSNPVPPDLTGNWQIQSSVDPGQTPPVGIVLFGALQSSGNQVSGTFRYTDLAHPATCGLIRVVNITGSVDSKNNLSLNSSTMPNGTTIKVFLEMAGSQQPYSGTGTIEVDGSTCTFPSTVAIGNQILSTSGTFAGTLAPGTLVSPGSGPSATISLVLAQSATPQSDGQYPATGTLNYAVGSCAGSASLSGTVSGSAVILSWLGGLPTDPQEVSFLGAVNPATTSIGAGVFMFRPTPCSTDSTSSTTYTGTLNRQ
jgi:hypothetical protein